MALQPKLQQLAKEYQALQSQYAGVVTNRQRLDAQQIENEQVRKEFDQLEDGKQIYKLVGPVLLKQETKEAKQNVKNRLDRIQASIQTVEEQLKDLEQKLESKKLEIVHIQTQLQQQAQTADPSRIPQSQRPAAAAT